MRRTPRSEMRCEPWGWMFGWLLVVQLPIAACSSVENIGYMTGMDGDDSGTSETSDEDGDSGSDTPPDTAIDSETSGDSDTDAFVRVPFLVSSTTDYFYFRVNPEDNELGFQGGWYTYADMSGTSNQMYFDANGNACAKGHVAQWYGDMDTWTFAGLGVGICFEPEVSSTCYTLSNCPYIDSLDVEVVGVAFEVRSVIDAALRLQFLQQSSSASTYIDTVVSEDTYYLFSDSVPTHPASPTQFADVSNVQVQVVNSEEADVEFDFCLLNFSLLVKP